jgi:hypothetical protein
MSELENQLEDLLGGLDRRDAEALAVAVDALVAERLADPDLVATWHARLVRKQSRRPALDPELRARCMALLDGFTVAQAEDGETIARHFFGAGLITWLDFERVADRLFSESSPDAADAVSSVDPGMQQGGPVGCRAPQAVRLGPAAVADGLRVVWMMSFDEWLELGVRRVGPGGHPSRDPSDVFLDDGAGQIHRPTASAFRDGYGQLRFAHPRVATVQLAVAGERITLDLVHEASA